jgi:DNA polymerase I-like protein with 3'-5' exonuclease and polymerase domains
VYLASNDLITPQAFEILKRVKEDTIGDFPLEFAPVTDMLPPRATVFAMGKYARRGSERVVVAPTVGQIVTKADIVSRLGQAFKLLTTPPELPEFEYTVLRSKDILLENLRSIRNRSVVVDIETSGDIDADVPEPSRIITIAFSFGDTAYVIPEELCQDREAYLAVCLFLNCNRIITVNGKFDLKYFPDSKANHYFDAQLAHYALYPAAGEHGLKPVTKKLFGFEDWDLPGKAYTKKATYDTYEKFEDGSWHDARSYSGGSGFERIPRAMLYEYAGFDVYATWHFAKAMVDDLAHDEDSTKALAHLMKLSDLFMPVEKRGIRLDIPYLEHLSGVLTVEKAEAEARLNEIAGQPINPRSPKQVKEWFTEHGVPLTGTAKAVLVEFIEKTETEAADAKEAIEFSNGFVGYDTPGGWVETSEPLPPIQLTSSYIVDFAKQLLVCRGITKQLGTYVDGYRNQADAAGRVYPGYRLIASTTGRLGGQGASMLTIPRDKRLKKMVIADPGQLVIGADLSQAELRVMACESMDQWLIDAFQPGAGDFFDLLLTQAYPDRDWFELHRRVSAHEATEEEANFYNNARASMKGVVYGVSFNRGTKAIAASLKIPMHEAQKLVDAFIRPGSDFSKWRDMIIDKAVSGGHIVTKFGRHFQSELVTRKNKHLVINSALAFTSQSTANDICLLAALESVPQLENYDAYFMGSVHDALYVSGPDENKEIIGKLLTDSLAWAGREVYNGIVEFDADWGYGPSMADV